MKIKKQQKEEPELTIEQENSSVFHHIKKDCRFGKTYSYLRGIRTKDYGRTFDNRKENRATRKECWIHGVLVCHCGWEVGAHYAHLEKGYKPPK